MNNNTVRRLKQKMKVHFTSGNGLLCGASEGQSTNYLAEVTCERCLTILKAREGWIPLKEVKKSARK
jgi:hypothetical protein